MATRLACAVGLSREPLKRYLIQFAHDHLDFRLQVLKNQIFSNFASRVVNRPTENTLATRLYITL